jgi:hypothetical protein
MTRLFICYSSKDLPFIEELRTHLSALPETVQVWYDRRIGVGDDWPEHLRRELHRSTHLLACLSSDMLASKWCQAEWTYAYDNNIFVFPLRLREVSVPTHEVFKSQQCHPPLDHEPIVTGAGDRILRDKAWADAVRKIAGWLDAGTPRDPPRRAASTSPVRPLSAVRLEATLSGATWHYRTTPNGPLVAQAPFDRATIDAALDRAAVQEPLHALRDGEDPAAEALRIGDALGKLLLPNGPLAALGIDPQRQAPADRDVRCRLHTDDPLLRSLPWSLTRTEGRRLADDGWTFEVIPAVAPTAHAILRAPAAVRIVHPGAPDPRDDSGDARVWHAFRADLDNRFSRLWPSSRAPLSWAERRADLQPAEVVVILARAEGFRGKATLVLDSANPVYGQDERVSLNAALEALSPSTLLVLLPYDAAAPVPLPTRLGATAAIVPTVPILTHLEAVELARALLHALFEHGRDPVDAVSTVAATLDTAAARGLQVLGAFEQWTTRRPAAAKRFENHAWYALDRRAQRERTERIVRDLRLPEQSHRLHLVLGLGTNADSHRLEFLSYILVHDLLGAFGNDLIRHDLAFPTRPPTGADPASLGGELIDAVLRASRARAAESLPIIDGFRAHLRARPERPVLWLDWGCLSRARPVRHQPDGRVVDDRRRPVSLPELTQWLDTMRRTLADGLEKRNDLAVVSFVAVGTDTGLGDLREHLDRWSADGARLRVDVLTPLEHVSAHDIQRFLEDEVCAPTCAPGRAADIAWWLFQEHGGDFNATAHAIETWGEPEGYARYLKKGPRPPLTPDSNNGDL